MTRPISTAGGQTLLCGICRAPIARRVEEDPHSDVGCARCDNWANADQAVKIAAEFVKDNAENELGAAMRKAARGSKFLKFTGKPKRHRQHRFIVEL